MWSDMPPNESDTRDKPEAGALFAWGFSIKNAWFWQQLAFTCLRLFKEFGHWKCQEYLGVTWNWNCFKWCHVWNSRLVQRICLVLGNFYGTHFLDKVWQRPNIVWKRQLSSTPSHFIKVTLSWKYTHGAHTALSELVSVNPKQSKVHCTAS